MARSIETEIEINGTATQVWEVLTDFGRYPEWNPFILRIAGTLQTGSKLRAVVQTPHFPKITIQPLLLKVEAEHELRWLGHWVVPKIFDGEHLFAIEPLGESKVNFVQKELFTGLLVPLLWRKMAGNILLGFENMSQALKKRVECREAQDKFIGYPP
jgi:hypothetical protein